MGSPVARLGLQARRGVAIYTQGPPEAPACHFHLKRPFPPPRCHTKEGLASAKRVSCPNGFQGTDPLPRMTIFFPLKAGRSDLVAVSTSNFVAFCAASSTEGVTEAVTQDPPEIGPEGNYDIWW